MAYLPPLKYRQIGPPMAEYLKQRKNVEEGNVYKRILIIYFLSKAKQGKKKRHTTSRGIQDQEATE